MLISRRKFLTYSLLSFSTMVFGAHAVPNVDNDPFLIIGKFIHPDIFGERGRLKLPPSGAMLAIWQSGQISYIRREGDLGEIFISGFISARALRNIRARVEREIMAKRYRGGIEIHGVHNSIQYRYAKEEKFRFNEGETPNGKTAIEKLLSFIRSLPIKQITEHNGFILPNQN